MLTISYGYRKKKKVFFCQHQRTYFLFHTKLHNFTKLFEGGWFDLHHSLKDFKKKKTIAALSISILKQIGKTR